MKQIVVMCVASILGGCAVEDVDTDAVTQAHKNKPPDGEQLFRKGEFDGNGTTCESCHSRDTGTLNPTDVQRLLQRRPHDELFQHDRADTIGGNTFERFRTHATILITRPLPANVRIVGSDARSVVVARGIPTTANTPALDPVLMLDGRDPDLLAQASGAIAGHAEGVVPSTAELQAIADFEKTLFNRSNLRKFAERGKPLKMPKGHTESEKRGRRFFLADDKSSPDDVGENTDAVCGWCHSGPFLNGASAFFGSQIAPSPLPEGHRFFSVRVSELNRIGNPTYTFQVLAADGVTVLRTATTPDPGAVLNTGNNGLFNQFKSTTLWGVNDTAPYFHDNSANTLEELMDHYDQALNIISSGNPKVGRIIDLTDQEKIDIAAYLRLLGRTDDSYDHDDDDDDHDHHGGGHHHH
jgi:cytochrome c peroxidase